MSAQYFKPGTCGLSKQTHFETEAEAENEQPLRMVELRTETEGDFFDFPMHFEDLPSPNDDFAWLSAFDPFSGETAQAEPEAQPIPSTPVANDEDDSDSVSSQSTRADILQLNSAEFWLAAKRKRPLDYSSDFQQDIQQQQSSSSSVYKFSKLEPEPAQKTNASFWDCASMGLPSLPASNSMCLSSGSNPANFSLAESAKPRKEHPSSNTATLKKRQGLTTSKFNGVCWNKRKQKWRARLSNKGTREFLGDFDTEAEAARAFDERIKQLLPPKKYMAKLNFKELA